jgi:hypothetical protein
VYSVVMVAVLNPAHVTIELEPLSVMVVLVCHAGGGGGAHYCHCHPVCIAVGPKMLVLVPIPVVVVLASHAGGGGGAHRCPRLARITVTLEVLVLVPMLVQVPVPRLGHTPEVAVVPILIVAILHITWSHWRCWCWCLFPSSCLSSLSPS